MKKSFLAKCALLAVGVSSLSATASAQNRSSDNAISQAEDAFGFSVGRESIGIYSAGQARGFSPTAAGNVRIDGLYFDPAFGLPNALVDSVSIKVGLSAQGYPFSAPSGIVDQTLNKPGDKRGASLIVSGDQFGGAGLELDGTAPISKDLSVGYGLNGSKVEYPDGTDAWQHGQSLIARWHSGPVELIPFWSMGNDYNDEANPFVLPLGPHLPVLAKPRHYEGPGWSDFRWTGTDSGLLSSITLAKDWVLRAGAFRSKYDMKTAYTNFLQDQLPDGSGERIVIASPDHTNISYSGEVRLTHSFIVGPTLHVLYFSVRGRDARREFGGDDLVDLGPGRVGQKVDVPKPDFHFGAVGHDRLKQLTYGLAYDGRWKNVGEVSVSVARADFRKRVFLPDSAVPESKSSPWLYSGTAAAQITRGVTAYAGYARGLEESGTAPADAVNRNSPLPVILTQQKDAGLSVTLARGIKAIAGVFDLRRPYFGYNSANVFEQVGTTRNQGFEFSVSGSLGPNLDIVAGGVLLKARVTKDADADGIIGSRPVGIPTNIINLNANWKTPAKHLQLDAAIRHRGKTPSTINNLVFLPAREEVDFGTHYNFKLAGHGTVLRLQVHNLFNSLGYGIGGSSGVYGRQPGRYVLGYLTTDF